MPASSIAFGSTKGTDIRRGRIIHVAIAALVLFASLPVTPAVGGSGSVQQTDTLESILIEQMGMLPDQAAMFADSMTPVGPDDTRRFGWGGDASVPATISEEDEPWTVPTAVGFNWVHFKDPATLPDFTSGGPPGMVMGSTEGGALLGEEYFVATALMADDIPGAEAISGIRQTSGSSGDGMLFKQFDFPLLVAGLIAWAALSQFPDDTWNLATLVLSLAYGPNPWSLAFYLFGAGGEINPLVVPGFFYVYGNLIMIGILASALGTRDVRGRFAFDVKNAQFNPDRSVVGTVPADTSQPNSFLDAYRHTTVPGLDGRFDPYEVVPLVGPDSNLWFNVRPRTLWGLVPPGGFFSWYMQTGYHGDPTNPDHPNQWVGASEHAGKSELFGSGPDGPLPGAMGYIQDNGTLLFGTPWPFTGEPFTVTFDGGNLPTEDGQFLYNSFTRTFGPDDVVVSDDPTMYDGQQPRFDFSTFVPVDEPEVTPTTSAEPGTGPGDVTTTAPAPGTGPGDVTTTAPAPTGITTTTTEQVPSGEACWWCWGAVALFLAVLLCLLYIWLKSYDWWTCWLPWFIVIFFWVPFLLAGMWWWRPAWWWVPLLAWFPIIGGYTWYWARHRSWWQPWHLYVVGGYLVGSAVAMLLVGSPEWGLLFPVFWVPWVGFYLWFRGSRQVWFAPWMWLLFAAYVVWMFIWVIALTPWWAWWFPVVFFAGAGWWFVSHGYRWSEIRGPKWCWVLPFSFLPFLAWWIPLWGPWWCFVIIGVLALTLLCAIFNHFKEEEWWTCWLPWFLVIWVGIPFLLAGLWFFAPNWWWLPLLSWFIVIPGYAYWWAQRRGWWEPWHWYVVFGYLAAAAALMYIVGSPTWGLLFPVFWLGPVAFYLWYRPRRQPWFQPWMWGLFIAYVAWVFIWVIWLTPFWGWWFPVFFVPFFGWWGIRHGYEDDVWTRKSCALIPMALLPWLGYMLAIYCIPEYYL